MSGVSTIIHVQMNLRVAQDMAALLAPPNKIQDDPMESIVHELCCLLIDGVPAGPVGPPVLLVYL